MEIDAVLAERAMKEALTRYPDMERFGPKLIWRPLFQGGAFLLEYSETPPREHPDAWEFQNAVVKGYKRLAGI